MLKEAGYQLALKTRPAKAQAMTSLLPRQHGYQPPAGLRSFLANRTSAELFCRNSDRSIVLDVVDLLDRFGLDADTSAIFARARCQRCGAHLHIAGGVIVGVRQRSGHMARLITADGSDFLHSTF